MDTFTVQDSTAMSWWRNNFWIILAVAIIVVSVGLGLILYCVCKWQLRRGKKWEIAKPLKHKQVDEEKMYENVLNESPVQLPPLPPRNWPSLEDSYGVLLCHPGWSAMARSRLTASSASRVHAILLPQPPE
ncbi:SLP adaptor and CSK interacting membrane protein [Homo sapiens]|uniref:SLP adaptor and CSK interacting membrane protein n=1 Tax=Homo sapiens TaxID=9606 RepID=I3L1W2_HUMAN|nr:SLP adapter and CSK-interacting membrane protein isoform X1 [Homo sapiens]XP_054172003.1 SLP adapter and CSK-interacting membrane protein isoform X1 [Homo sapiens]KAI2580818.1 SLP adaptor and CSK interacting membrane protein [Homo sapiens]KAI4047330.1 SLP adaptor and CSK interacting membrane protein [Homo sapiens]